MGRLHASEYIARLGRGIGLRTHMELNFYPRISFEAREIIISNFTAYWRDKFPTHILLRNINLDLKKADGKIIGLNNLNMFIEFFND